MKALLYGHAVAIISLAWRVQPFAFVLEVPLVVTIGASKDHAPSASVVAVIARVVVKLVMKVTSSGLLPLVAPCLGRVAPSQVGLIPAPFGLPLVVSTLVYAVTFSTA